MVEGRLTSNHDLADVDATEALGVHIGRSLRAGDLITLDGPLGSGKTCIVRGIAEGLGIDPSLVTSPSFILMQRYTEGALGLVHIDAWRMRGEQDLMDLGLEEILAAKRDVVAIEWPSKVATALPRSAVHLTITLTPRGGRSVSIVDQRE